MQKEIDQICDSKKVIMDKYVFWFCKRVFDIIVSIMFLPLMIVISFILLFLNPYFNKGTVFFVQTRMGKNCKPFSTIKFRSMVHEDIIKRNYNDPIEIERITPLGKIIRKLRIDEIPQIINVLKGEMSLIGPRPDYYPHALDFSIKINNYKLRHTIRPGVSGLSQIRLGYAEGIEATEKKVLLDLYYIKNVSFLLDLKILFGTIYTIFRAKG